MADLSTGTPPDEQDSEPDEILVEDPTDLVVPEVVLQRAPENLRAAAQRLHSALQQTRHNEAALRRRTVALQDQIKLHASKPRVSVAAPPPEIDELQRELFRAANEVTMAAARERCLHDEVARARGEVDNARQELSSLSVLHAVSTFNPEFETMRMVVREMEAEGLASRAALVPLHAAITDTEAAIAAAQAGVAALDAEEVAIRAQIAAAQAEPPRIERQEAISTSLLHAASATLLTAEATLDARRRHVAALTQQRDGVEARVVAEDLARGEGERVRGMQAHAEADALVEQGAVRAALTSALADRAAVSAALTHTRKQLKTAAEAVVRVTRDKDAAVARLEQLQLATDALTDDVRSVRATESDLRGAVAAAGVEATGVRDAASRARSDMDVFAARVTQGNKLTERAVAEVEQLVRGITTVAATVANEQRIVAQLSRTAQSRQKQLDQATIDQRRGLAALALATDAFASKQAAIADHLQRAELVAQGVAEMDAVYEVVKHDRSKCQAQLHASGHRMVALQEKLKLVRLEREMMHTAVVVKEAELVRTRQETGAIVLGREAIHTDVSVARIALQKLRVQKLGVNHDNKRQLDEIERLESRILGARSLHERAIKDRNALAVQVVSRHNELCAVYDRVGVATSTERSGRVELSLLVEQNAFLALEKQDVQRRVAVLEARQREQTQHSDALVAAQLELLHARQAVAALEVRAESTAARRPEGVRVLPGRDATPADLHARETALLARLAAKESQCALVTATLDDARALLLGAARTHQQLQEQQQSVPAPATPTAAAAFASSVAEYKVRLREATTRVMAIVAELSMAQAASLQLEQVVHEQQHLLVEAQQRVQQGKAPSPDAELEWEAMVARVAAATRQQTTAFQQHKAMEQQILSPLRPNAYLPDAPGALPIPRPYGRDAPFKPPAPSPQQRFFRHGPHDSRAGRSTALTTSGTAH